MPLDHGGPRCAARGGLHPAGVAGGRLSDNRRLRRPGATPGRCRSARRRPAGHRRRYRRSAYGDQRVPRCRFRHRRLHDPPRQLQIRPLRRHATAVVRSRGRSVTRPRTSARTPPSPELWPPARLGCAGCSNRRPWTHAPVPTRRRRWRRSAAATRSWPGAASAILRCRASSRFTTDGTACLRGSRRVRGGPASTFRDVRAGGYVSVAMGRPDRASGQRKSGNDRADEGVDGFSVSWSAKGG